MLLYVIHIASPKKMHAA